MTLFLCPVCYSGDAGDAGMEGELRERTAAATQRISEFIGLNQNAWHLEKAARGHPCSSYALYANTLGRSRFCACDERVVRKYSSI